MSVYQDSSNTVSTQFGQFAETLPITVSCECGIALQEYTSICTSKLDRVVQRCRSLRFLEQGLYRTATFWMRSQKNLRSEASVGIKNRLCSTIFFFWPQTLPCQGLCAALKVNTPDTIPQFIPAWRNPLWKAPDRGKLPPQVELLIMNKRLSNAAVVFWKRLSPLSWNKFSIDRSWEESPQFSLFSFYR